METATQIAFNSFRAKHGPAWGPRIIRDASEADQLDSANGLDELVDGAGSDSGIDDALPPMSNDNLPAQRRLWVVRDLDVVHAPEDCQFGTERPAGKLKHTNLTGGAPAFSGGELLILDSGTLVISGDSGRYGPRSEVEMRDVASAFKGAGYTVYSMGYDEDAARAMPLVGGAPRLI